MDLRTFPTFRILIVIITFLLIIILRDTNPILLTFFFAAAFLIAALTSHLEYQMNRVNRQRYITLAYVLLAILELLSVSVKHFGAAHVPDWRSWAILLFALYCFEQSGWITGDYKLFRKPHWKRFALIASIFFGSIAIGIILIEHWVKM